VSGAAAIRSQGDVASRATLGGAVDRGHGAGGPAEPIRTGAKDIPFRWVPLAPLVAAMSLGIVADRFVEPWPTSAWITLILAYSAIAALTFRRDLVSSLTLLAAFWAIGGGWHHDWWWDRDRDDLSGSITESPRSAWVRGVIRDALGVRRSDRNPYGSGVVSEASDPARSRTRFVVDLTAINDGRRWNPVSGRAMVIVMGDRGEIRAGEAIEAAGQLARVPGPLNPGEFDYRDFLRGQGIDLRLTVDDPDGLDRDPEGRTGAFVETLGRLRSWSRSHLVDRLDPTIEPLAAAFLLGQREGVEPEVNDAFARTGTTHLLAISGLHLQVLAVAMLLAARAIGLPRRPAHLIVALLTIGYAVLVGAAPSVVRSTVMTVTFCLAAIADRTARPANTLALAALGTLAFNPVYLFDVGCQLSFLAIAALFWLVPLACARVWSKGQAVRDRLYGPRSPLDELERRLEPWWRTRLRRIGARLIDGVVASTVVWMAALPLVALRFHIISPIGILLNIPLIPITSAALLFGGLGLGLSAVWGPLGGPATWTAGGLLQVTQSVVLWGVAQPWGHRFAAGPSSGWVLVFYGLLGLAAISATAAARSSRVGRLARKGPWWLLAIWSGTGLILAVIPTRPTTPDAEVLAVGHGLAVLIRTPGGQTLLYDCGRMGDPAVGRRIIAPALWSHGISRIDTVILSHADQDHFNGLSDLLDRFTIGTVRIPPGFGGPANPRAVQLIHEVRSRDIPVRETSTPEAWESGGVRFTVQHPPSGWYPDASDNARSLVLDVAHGGRHLLLTGDLEQMGLIELIARPCPDPPPDILLAPHHGGKSANPPSLYQWANPRSVVVSQRPLTAGSNDALSPLERRNLPLWRTWRDGAIRLQWTAEGIVARGFLEQANALTNEEGPSRTANSASFFPIASIGAWSSPGTIRIAIGLGGFALGAILWAVLAVVEFGAWTLIVPPRVKRGRDDDGDEVTTRAPGLPSEPIAVRAADGAKLAGRWYPAPGLTATGRTVLLLHGFADNASAWEGSRVSMLNRHGWNVAALDSRGYGDSEGPYASFGGREAGDIRAWLDALADRIAGLHPTSPVQPALWGRSMGAAIALRTAAEDHRIAALVLESPMVDLDTSVAALLRSRRLPFARHLAHLITRRAAKLAGVSLSRPRPLELAPRVDCATLIIHGTNDSIVPIDDARRLADALASTPRWFDVPGAGHINVISVGGDELIDHIAAFLDEAAQGKSSTEE
jgi:competence protein ComEC